ncbi:MAG: RagB/SusD family nutrient uptake outer membrane protein [Mesonia hippocampi]|uniref:RagB/SusD family nutrient uptake outer membrane protein n=1 Tax=Mesonia hippocampi TaxID=1628250 RepID=UPI003F96B778
MKKFNKFLVFISLLSCFSCSDFLEVEKVGKVSTPVYFSDLDGIKSAIPGAYSSVYKYYNSEFYIYPQVAGDLLDLRPTNEGVKVLDQYNYISDASQEASTVGHIWTNAFHALANINNILKYQPELLNKYPKNHKELEQIKAQALFLRALVHFDLVRTYAQNYTYTPDASHLGVPVLLSLPGAEDNIGRSSVKKVYDQILSDLHEANDIFENEGTDTNQTQPYFGSDIAAKALLSRVYLYMEDWEKSKTYAQQVLLEVDLTSHDAYVDMFKTSGPSQEAIFTLSGIKKNSFIKRFYSTQEPSAFASKKLQAMFTEPSDVRLELLQNVEGSGNLMTLKYFRPEEAQLNGSDLPVLRASEMVLNLAEANANLGLLEEAKDNVKTIQARALGVSETSIVINAVTQQEVLEVISIERAKELCFEGQRFFDITRRHKDLERSPQTTSNVEHIAYPSNLFVLPIPLKEMNTNHNMIQNEGY